MLQLLMLPACWLIMLLDRPIGKLCGVWLCGGRVDSRVGSKHGTGAPHPK
jgi:hypothetical protein